MDPPPSSSFARSAYNQPYGNGNENGNGNGNGYKFENLPSHATSFSNFGVYKPASRWPNPSEFFQSPSSEHSGHIDQNSMRQFHQLQYRFPLDVRNSLQVMQSRPSSKRRRVGDNSFATFDSQVKICGNEGIYFAADPSECCSTCDSGEPCSESVCGVEKDVLVPCSDSSCEPYGCTAQSCLEDSPSQHLELNGESDPSEGRLSAWTNNAWSTQAPRSHKDLSFDLNKYDPNLIGGTIQPEASSASPTPSLGMSMATPQSDPTMLPSPHYPDDSYPRSDFGSELSNTGTQFNGNFALFECQWRDCGLPMQSQDELFNHFHQQHLDSQMAFSCPMPSSCRLPAGSNPVDHLKMDHGLSFGTDNNGIPCPAPNCLPSEMYCNPSMLHMHIDQAHATPAQGQLQCRWKSCNASVSDPYQLLEHMHEEHQISIPHTPGDISLPVDLPTTFPIGISTSLPVPEEENHLACKWKIGENSLCGIVCLSEKELQDHVKKLHLKDLSGETGYLCQWQGCTREKKYGIEKCGFSQRGKLERHMATHTGCQYHFFIKETVR